MTAATPVQPHFAHHFKQHAAGDFLAHVVPGTNHCGINDESGRFRFEIDIDYHGHGSPLDSHGFLLDNLDFQRYFDNLPPLAVSCELVAEQACEHFIALLGDRAECVQHIEVRICPFGEVYVEADLEVA